MIGLVENLAQFLTPAVHGAGRHHLVLQVGNQAVSDFPKGDPAVDSLLQWSSGRPFRQTDIIKNQELVFNRQEPDREVSLESTKIDLGSGENYCYVRVQEADGQLAWSSPIWITRRDGT